MARHRHALAAKAYVGGRQELRGGGEPPLFVKLLIVRQIRFRHKPEEFAALAYSGTVDEHTAMGDRHAYDNDNVEVVAEFEQFEQCRLCFFQQQLLRKEVLAGVGREREFGKADNFHAQPLCLCHKAFNAFRVVGAVGHAYRRNGGCHFDKSVLHCRIVLKNID